MKAQYALELSGDEDLFPRNARCLDRLANSSFGACKFSAYIPL